MIKVHLPTGYLARQVWLCIQRIPYRRQWEIRARDKQGSSFEISVPGVATSGFATKRHAEAVLSTLPITTLWVESDRGAAA